MGGTWSVDGRPERSTGAFHPAGVKVAEQVGATKLGNTNTRDNGS